MLPFMPLRCCRYAADARLPLIICGAKSYIMSARATPFADVDDMFTLPLLLRDVVTLKSARQDYAILRRQHWRMFAATRLLMLLLIAARGCRYMKRAQRRSARELRAC